MVINYIQGMKNYSTTLLMNSRVLDYTYDRGSLLFKCIFVYLCECLYMNVISFYVYIVSLVFYHQIVCVLHHLTNKLVCKGFFRVCCKRTWFLDFSERCTPRFYVKNNKILHGVQSDFYTSMCN